MKAALVYHEKRYFEDGSFQEIKYGGFQRARENHTDLSIRLHTSLIMRES